MSGLFANWGCQEIACLSKHLNSVSEVSHSTNIWEQWNLKEASAYQEINGIGTIPKK